MTITFYSAKFSSALPVACTLNELGVAHERIDVDLSSGALKKPEFLALNPNAKVPTLVVDGTPMFEGLAIVQWLGDRYGVSKGLWPAADAPARMTALAWTAWGYVTYGAALGRLNFATSERFAAELHNPAQATHAKNELAELLGMLEARLAAHPYMLGAQYSLVDLVLANLVRYSSMCGVATDAHPRVSAWVEGCFARPAIRTEWA